MKIKIDLSETDQMFEDLVDLPDDVMEKAFKFYKSITPIREGNARRRTIYRRDKIQSRYPYAGELDEGKSKQAPKGMTEPTIKKIDELVEQYVKGI